MLVVLGYCHRDIDQARSLFGWCRELDGSVPQHELLLLASSQIQQSDVEEMDKLAKQVFPRTISIKQKVVEEGGWPAAPNGMWRAALEWLQRNARSHWLWCEPDLVPIAPGWLDTLEKEYRLRRKPVMGAVFHIPFKHINGTAVYPRNLLQLNPFSANPGKLPFDLVRPELTYRNAHVTNLIQRSLADPSTNTPHSFPDQESLGVILPETILFHGCKTPDIFDRLRERRKNGTPRKTMVIIDELAEVPASVWKAVKSLLPGQLKTTSKTVFYHTGNLGDVIYSLCAIKLAGGGDLVIGPARGTAPCSVPISLAQFNRLKPLLEAQPYIRSARFVSHYPAGQIQDLNRFRNLWFDLDTRIESGANSLCAMHCHLLGVLDRFNEKEPWLTLPNKEKNGRVIIARSLRHRSWDMDYGEVIRAFGEACLFIGTEQEWIVFQVAWPKLEYRPVKDFLEMATLIGGARGMACNQSFPNALALGLGVPVLQETFWPAPDCMFRRRNFFNQKQVTEFISYV